MEIKAREEGARRTVTGEGDRRQRERKSRRYTCRMERERRSQGGKGNVGPEEGGREE